MAPQNGLRGLCIFKTCRYFALFLFLSFDVYSTVTVAIRQFKIILCCFKDLFSSKLRAGQDVLSRLDDLSKYVSLF